MDHGLEALVGFVGAHGDAVEFLELAKEQLRFGDQATVIRRRDLLHLLDQDTGRAMLHWLAGIIATLPKGWTGEMKLVESGSDRRAT